MGRVGKGSLEVGDRNRMPGGMEVAVEIRPF